MTTLRQAHRKKFTSISNQLIQNNDLSLSSRGLMIYLLSLPDDWKIHVNHLVSIFKEGKYTIMKLLTELKEAGYIYHHKEGYKEGWNYYVFEEPITLEEFKKFLRTIDFSEQFENLNNSEISHYKILKEKEEKTKELTNIQKGDVLTVISICPYKKEFIGITLDDMKEWRSKYHSLNLDKELKMIAEKCYGKTITSLKNYINQTLHNKQEKRLLEARPRRQEPSLQISAPMPATNDDYESNTKIAKYIAALADKENINYSYKIEFTHQGLRFNKPSSNGCVDLSLHQPSLQFRQSCKMHLTKLAVHHSSFNEVIQRL